MFYFALLLILFPALSQRVNESLNTIIRWAFYIFFFALLLYLFDVLWQWIKTHILFLLYVTIFLLSFSLAGAIYECYYRYGAPKKTLISFGEKSWHQLSYWYRCSLVIFYFSIVLMFIILTQL